MNLFRLIALSLTHLATVIETSAISQIELSSLKARATLGDNSAKHRLGEVLILAYDYKKSSDEQRELIDRCLEYFRSGSESGHPGCMGKYALYQMAGAGSLEKNEPEGLKLLIKAAELKDPDSLAFLSSLYLEGKCGLPVDRKRGVELLEESCRLGSAIGLGHRAGSYELGLDGYPKDNLAFKRDALACAVAAEEKAADIDSPEMQVTLYEAYARAEKYDDARKWQDKAIQSGHHKAIVDRGFSHMIGSRGETKDLVKAYAFYNLAASLRPEPWPDASRKYSEIRDNLAQNMTGNQIAEAQRLSSEMNAKIRK